MGAFLVLLLAARLAAAAPDLPHWFPRQVAPKAVVVVDASSFRAVPGPNGEAAPPPTRGPEHMLAQSLAGLAAKAVNEGKFDELVWIAPAGEAPYARWLADAIARLDLEQRGTFTVWELLRRYRERGIVEGYVLYSYDHSSGELYHARAGKDESANVATTVAGPLRAVMIAEEQEARALRLGLPLLADARGKTERWCFDHYRDRLLRTAALAQDPKVPQNRAIAIAADMMVFFGASDPTEDVYRWLTPPASILGYNFEGDEADFVSAQTRYGHVCRASNWCLNLPLLSVGACEVRAKLTPCDPHRIDWSGTPHAVAFTMSDGDNLQWTMRGFHDARFWNHPARGTFPMGWGFPLGAMQQVAPDILAHVAKTQTSNTTVSMNGGYFYSDLLGAALGDEAREEVLRRYAREIGAAMARANCRTLIVFTMDLRSPAAHQAYRIYAEEIDALTGMFVVQYAPYEAGRGAVFWVEGANGFELPVVTCRHTIWSLPDSTTSGGPSRVARLLNEGAATTDRLLAWVMPHAWSRFARADEATELVPADHPGAEGGLFPVQWCIDALDERIRVVSPEELLWRIRMAHDPAATRRAIAAWRTD